MEISQKEKLYDILFKIALYALIIFAIYNLANILVVSHIKGKKLQSRIQEPVDRIKSNMALSEPPETVDPGPPPSLPTVAELRGELKIEKALIFAGSVKIGKPPEGKGDEGEDVSGDIPRIDDPFKELLDTWIAFKGVTDDLALINVKRKIDEQIQEHSFPIRIGERIGREKIIAKKSVDFRTNCTLQKIVPNAQRVVTLQKKVVILDEEGGYVGTRIEPGEKFTKYVPKILYISEEGGERETKVLWLGQEEQIVEEPKEEEEKTFFEDPLGATKKKYEGIKESMGAKIKTDDIKAWGEK